MANRKQKNIRKYRRAWNINIGMVVFFLIFIYICICIVSYMTKKHISVYEVKQGTIASDNTYTGLIFRTETVKTAAKSGYVNYFAREGQRVGVKSVVYTIDESGKTASLLEENEEAAALTSDDYKAIKSEITSFTNSFSENNFNALYDFKYSMDGTILELVHLNLLNNIDGIENNSSLFQIYKPDESGILTYSIDGFENVQPEQVTAEMFDEGNYSKTFLKNQELVSEGDPVYKLITDENWSVVIPLDKERSKDIPSDDYIEVTFSKDQTTAWAYVTQFESNGKKYAKLAFTNSMVRFATDRYLELELKLDDIEGLKIPVTSVVEKPFYVIPADYITHGGDIDEEGVLMEKYQEDGSVQTVFEPITPYYVTDEQYYIDMNDMEIGTYLIKTDSTDRYPIGKTENLVGVYNVNKGYAVFRQINILYQNKEYCIVESNSKYGLSQYDHIVLDSSAVKEEDIIY